MAKSPIGRQNMTSNVLLLIDEASITTAVHVTISTNPDVTEIFRGNSAIFFLLLLFPLKKSELVKRVTGGRERFISSEGKSF